MHDARYQSIQDLISALPAQARENRIAIYRARPDGRFRNSRPPIKELLQSEFIEEGLGETETLKTWVSEKLGPGQWWLEAHDNAGHKIEKIPGWCVDTRMDEDMQEDGFSDDDLLDQRPARGRRGSRDRYRLRYADGEDDDDDLDDLVERGNPKSSRANVVDFVVGSAAAKAAEAQAAVRSQSDLMSSLMLIQQQNQAEAARREEERRREEKEERRREEERDERRREAEREKREREAEAERRRYEERLEERKRDEDRRDRELKAQIEAGTKRTEMMLSLISAAMGSPLLLNMINRKHEKDPMLDTLLQATLARSNDSGAMGAIVTAMTEASKAGTSIMMEQMRSAITSMTEVQQMMLKQAMKTAMANPNLGDEEKSTFSQVMEAIQGASSIVSSLTANRQSAPPAQTFQALQQPTQQMPQQPQQQTQALPAPAQAQQAQQAPVATEPEPVGIEAVVHGLVTLADGGVTSATDQNSLVFLILQEMPEDLGQAIVTGDEERVLSLCLPVIQSDQELYTWFATSGNIDKVRGVINGLRPHIQQALEVSPASVGGNQAEDRAEDGEAGEAGEVGDDDDDPNGI